MSDAALVPVWVRFPKVKAGSRCPVSGLSFAMVRRLASAGKLETRMIGRVRLIRTASLLDFIESCPVGGSECQTNNNNEKKE